MARDAEFNEPAPKKSHTLWYVLGCVGAALFLFCCVCPGGFMGFGLYTDSQNEKKVTAGAGTPITADALTSGYSDGAHQGKVLQVTGKVTNKGLLGVDLGKVSCMPSSTEHDKFDTIKVGDTVTIKGLCAGKTGDSIQMTNSHLVGR